MPQLTAALAPCALAITLASVLAPSHAIAAQKKVDQRWFEIEVILFSQLGDKGQLKETFGESKPLPNYKTFDLLTPYLNPTLIELKAQLPICHEQGYRASYRIEQGQLPHLFAVKSLSAINQETLIEPLADSLDTQSESVINATSATATQLSTTNPLTPTAEQAIDARRDGNFSITVSEPLVGLTTQEQALLDQAEQSFSPIQFTYTPTHENNSEFAFSYGSRNQFTTLCHKNAHPDNVLLTAANAINHVKDNFNNDSYPIDQLSGRINGREYIYTDDPYLISSDSLKLKDIYLQLRRSRNFKPLLHLGWRQSLINRKPASQTKALKIFAGEHFKQQYLNEKQQYQTKINEVALNTWLAEQLANNNERAIAGLDPEKPEQSISVLEPSLSPKALKLKYIFDNIEPLEVSTEQLVADVNNTNLFDSLVNSTENGQAGLTRSASTDISEPIIPVQPWFLDGLFRVHLSHYLYITADFNVSSLTGAELATQKLTADHVGQNANPTLNEQAWHSIPFSQNRRVISGEVHYFDHPYMGMIVQIRRYKKPEPLAQDSLSQTLNQ